MRFFFLPLPQNCFQFRTVCSNHFLFFLGSFDYYRHLIVVRVYSRLPSLEPCNGTDLCFRQLQDILDITGLIRLQVQNNFVF